MSLNSLHNYDDIIRSNEVNCAELESLPSFGFFEQPFWGSTNLNMKEMSSQGVVCAMIQNNKCQLMCVMHQSL